MNETMDPIIQDLAALWAAGIDIQRVPDPCLELYVAPGFPELTRNQVRDLASRRGDYSGLPRRRYGPAPFTPC